jgi:ring-1,2-phenylacetyl-CoA epoxidase subunit PaaD
MHAVSEQLTIEQIWSLLESVPDPEIPVISVVDLGIVRDVSRKGDEVTVTVTPTYSGCPATAVIAMEIEEALRRKGADRVRIEMQLSPAWTTQWITKQGREKLRAYGIAPPVEGANGVGPPIAACAGALKAPPAVACPRCASNNTERVSQFGSTPCKAHYRCKDCLEPFDYFKSF